MKTINLALQGGGSHGAFTWGVLDALLADDRLRIGGISGTSAGAVNAVALAHGFAQGGAVKSGALDTTQRQAARQALERVWTDITRLGSLGAMTQSWLDMLWGGLPPELAPTTLMANAMTSMVSPYQTNPMGINPLRQLLERQIDFDAVGKLVAPKIFVNATHVATGKAELFHGKRLTSQAVMASACLPSLFQAVEIEGEHYWDGGYSGNPVITPLIEHCEGNDLVLVQINPLKREQTPQHPHDIVDRVNELTFNASLLSQMRAIDFVNRLLAQGRLDGLNYRPIYLHRIDGGQALEAFSAASKTSTDAKLIKQLFELGEQSAQRWLGRHFEALGDQSSVNIQRDYLDDLRMGMGRG